LTISGQDTKTTSYSELLDSPSPSKHPEQLVALHPDNLTYSMRKGTPCPFFNFCPRFAKAKPLPAGAAKRANTQRMATVSAAIVLLVSSTYFFKSALCSIRTRKLTPSNSLTRSAFCSGAYASGAVFANPSWHRCHLESTEVTYPRQSAGLRFYP
jgi:hypothetical protein